ncbi:MAG: hypothetical protein JWN71_2835 [Xanthobacteraceae bacterium]|jgi:hypothetical protein|nr:hypothetical protein [Xanthobacteraceae bacterium]
MVQETPRAAQYRQRADAIDTAAQSLSPEDRATALRHQQALRHLADIEDWVAAEPHVAANHDYKLEPRPDAPPRGPVRANAPGRRATIRPVEPLEQARDMTRHPGARRS